MEAQDEATRPQLSGTVVDAASGQGIQGAHVFVAGEGHGVVTDDEGRFRGLEVPAGPVALRIRALGYGEELVTASIPDSPDPLVIPLEPDPVLLEGIEVMHNRLRARRNAVGAPVRAFEQEELSRSSAQDAVHYLNGETFVRVTACSRRGARGAAFGYGCVWVRGQEVVPEVYIDEILVPGGLEQLQVYQPWEFHLIEVYQRGRQIRAYTHRFMERLAERPQALLPVFLP